MYASLPMYDWPEVREATDAWWAGLRRHLAAEGFPDVPPALDRDTPAGDQWRSPSLLLSQTCGYPLTHALEGRVEVIAAPAYAADGCEGATYRSVIVVRAGSRHSALEHLRGSRAAYNGRDSLSGHLALRCVFAPLARQGRFFGSTVETGAHANSMRLVAEGEADVAAIDCVSFALAQAHRPKLARALRVIGTSPSAPSLPYITAVGRPRPEIARCKRALASACEDRRLSDARDALLLKGLEFVALTAYSRVLDLEAAADALGYTELDG